MVVWAPIQTFAGVSTVPADAGVAWIDCNVPDGVPDYCSVPKDIPITVRYGAQGNYLYSIFSGYSLVPCWRLFGDVKFGKPKTCSYTTADIFGLQPYANGQATWHSPPSTNPSSTPIVATITTVGSDAAWQYRGRYGAQITVPEPGMHWLRFGYGTNWYYTLINGDNKDTVPCTREFLTPTFPPIPYKWQPANGRRYCQTKPAPQYNVAAAQMYKKPCARPGKNCQLPTAGPALVGYGEPGDGMARRYRLFALQDKEFDCVGVPFGIANGDEPDNACFATQVAIKSSQNLVIRPLGDSITYGIGFSYPQEHGWCLVKFGIEKHPYYYNRCQPPGPLGGGYRGYMALISLTQAKPLAFKTEGANPSSSINWMWELNQHMHDGYPGWTAEQLQKIAGNTSRADVTLIHAGTNDLDGYQYSVEKAIENLQGLVQRVIANNSGGHIYVAKIIMPSPKGPNYTALRTKFMAYNNAIDAAIKPLAPERITIVDFGSLLTTWQDYYYDTKNGFAFDPLHPSALGYKKMACTWINAILGYTDPAAECKKLVNLTNGNIPDKKPTRAQVKKFMEPMLPPKN